MFYDKSVDILGETGGYVDNDGIWQEGTEDVLGTILADVQPYSRDLAYRDYGFDEQVSFRLFSDPNGLIKVGTKVQYNNDKYIINKTIPWDDYTEWMIKND
jgi:hypothetical protein